MSTHVPPQFVWPAGQHFVDEPSVWQVAPPVHVVVQSPQWLLSVRGSTHWLLQINFGESHDSASGGASMLASTIPLPLPSPAS